MIDGQSRRIIGDNSLLYFSIVTTDYRAMIIELIILPRVRLESNAISGRCATEDILHFLLHLNEMRRR